MRQLSRSMCLRGISMIALALCLLVLSARDVSANGAPIKIILTYVQGLSNWGPTSSTGVAEIVMKEGEVNLSVVGLPPLSNETYTGWIINTRSNESLNVGRFNSDKSETVKIQNVLPAEIPDKGWNLFLVTVEPAGQESRSPGERKSIAGYFPDSAEAKRLPSQLPKTGGDVEPSKPSLNQPPPSAARPASPGNLDLGNNLVTYGVVILAVLGLGALTRARMRR